MSLRWNILSPLTLDLVVFVLYGWCDLFSDVERP